MSVNIRIKRNKIYLDIYERGKRYWQSLHMSVPEDKQQAKEVMRIAEICRSKREVQITCGEWGLIDPLNGKQSLTSCMENNNKKNYFNNVINILNKDGKGNIFLENITEKWLEDFQDYLLKDTGLSKSTAKHYESKVRQVLKKAARDRLIPRNPSITVNTIKAPEAIKVHLEFKEIQALAKTRIGGDTGAEIKSAFLFACYTGLRISDLKTLQWGDITREPLQFAKCQKKTGQKVFIPLHELAWKIINDNQIHNCQSHIFPRLAKNKSSGNISLQVWAKRAGVEKQIGWHTARHTFAVLSKLSENLCK